MIIKIIVIVIKFIIKLFNRKREKISFNNITEFLYNSLLMDVLQTCHTFYLPGQFLQSRT